MLGIVSVKKRKMIVALDNINSFIVFKCQQAVIGPLPAGFLRLTTEREIQESADRQAAIALFQQQNASYIVSFH